LSSDDTDLVRSSSLTDRHLIKNLIQSTTIADDIIKQDEQIFSNNGIITPPQLSKCPSSSRQSSRMASPTLSTSSHSSGRVITLLCHEVIQLPVDLEREIRIKNNFNQLGKTRKK
jgi:hypothetical protein